MRKRGPQRRDRGRSRVRLGLEILEDRTLLNGTLTLSPTTPAVAMNTLGAAPSADVYSVTMPQDGLLILSATNAPSTRLSLLTQAGAPLVQSDGVIGPPGTDLIQQHLSGGTTYVVEIQELGAAASGPYTLQATYQPAVGPFQPIPIPAGPLSMAVGDFNGDGHPDLATANITSDSLTATVSILLGDGDGTFQPAVTNITLGQHSVMLAAADLGNGHMDLIAVNPEDGTVYVIKGNGDGTFQAPATYSTSASGAGSPLVANFNGFPDLAVANPNAGTVTILLGDGTGAFTSTDTLTVGTTPDSLVAGDFGNGNVDLAVADTGSADVSVLLGDGAGNFQNAVTYNLAGNPGSLVAADFNSDNLLDLAATIPSQNEVAVLLGTGAGALRRR